MDWKKTTKIFTLCVLSAMTPLFAGGRRGSNGSGRPAHQSTVRPAYETWTRPAHQTTVRPAYETGTRPAHPGVTYRVPVKCSPHSEWRPPMLPPPPPPPPPHLYPYCHRGCKVYFYIGGVLYSTTAVSADIVTQLAPVVVTQSAPVVVTQPAPAVEIQPKVVVSGNGAATPIEIKNYVQGTNPYVHGDN